jgi:hypothetical protein
LAAPREFNFGIAGTFGRHGASVSSLKQENVDTAVSSRATADDKVMGVAADVRDFTTVGRAFETACA